MSPPPKWSSIARFARDNLAAGKLRLLARSRWRTYTWKRLFSERKIVRSRIVHQLPFGMRRWQSIFRSCGRRVSLLEAVHIANEIGVPLEAIACCVVNGGLKAAWMHAQKASGGKATEDYLTIEKMLKPERHEDDEPG